jgi:hypothetical protein
MVSSEFSDEGEETTSAFNVLGKPAATTPGRANSLFAAMDAYYQQFRLRRDAQRNEFLQEVESFLLEHLTTPAPTALQQITAEFAFSPSAALSQSAKLRTSQKAAGSRGVNNTLNSPILGFNSKTRAQASSGTSSTSTKPSTLTPSPRGGPVGGAGLSKAALAHSAANKAGRAHDDDTAGDVDLNNRFAHYVESGQPTVHTIKVPGYIENFRIDLKALLTTKVKAQL